MKDGGDNSQDGAGLESPSGRAWTLFKDNRMAMAGLCGAITLLLLATAAPLLANKRPLLLYMDGAISFPALRFIFAPDSSEIVVERIFNYLLIFLPVAIVLNLLLRRRPWKGAALAAAAVLLLIPFMFSRTKLDSADWKKITSSLKQGEFAVYAPLKYGPFENISVPYNRPDRTHLLGTDQNGRDVFSRLIYGARVSLAVGIIATVFSMAIGIAVGLVAGYSGGRTDILIMRIVEIVMCFPTFLLLLILMVIMMDRNFKQSILLVIFVIGLTSWTGLCRIVRGEVLKQRSMAYIKSCESLGLPVWRIMAFHLLPNVAGPILVSFTFGIAGAILSESGLSFLGFGVQPPTASWGELLRESMTNPLQYWHLTLWPGLMIFVSVVSFNFIGEGVREAVDPQKT